MNGTVTTTTTTTSTAPPRSPKPPPTCPAPTPPSGSARQLHPAAPNGKSKKKADPIPIDPQAMYESLKSRIAALEEEEEVVEEEERRFAEEAQKHVRGLEENTVHVKYIELFAEFKRMEREHQKEKQKLLKDKDAAKSQLTKANQTKIKMENLARELQKDNKRLRVSEFYKKCATIQESNQSQEDGKRLSQSVEEAQDEIVQMKNDISRRAEKAKMQDLKYRQSPDIVVKVVCRYRAELFFKISRKTKFVKLFAAWTDRMETGGSGGGGGGGGSGKKPGEPTRTSSRLVNGVPGAPVATSSFASSGANFIFTHSGRQVDAEQTPEEAGMEDGDEILAVELMDLTEGPCADAFDESEPQRQKLKKFWTDDPPEAARSMEEIFDGVVRARLKDILRQYELRERHFECVIRSKELEVLLSRARAAEQKQLAEGEKVRAEKVEEENQQLRKELDDAQKAQTMLVERLISCCKEPNAERTQRLFASLREELEKRGSRASRSEASSVNGTS